MTIYAVNGKEPVAAWIPSLDTAGNGTTTLTDLVGSNNGTLTNMDAATDWVLDGGKYALDFDGSNDYVNTAYDPNYVQNTEVFAISGWVNRTNTSRHFICGTTLSSAEKGFFVVAENLLPFGVNALRVFISRGVSGNYLDYRTPDGSLVTGWHHFLITGNGSSVLMWIDGVSQSITTDHAGTWVNPTGASTRTLNIARSNWSSVVSPFGGRQDDMRFFTVTMDGADSSYLYDSGNGRGRVSTIRRQQRSQQIIS